MSKAKVSVAIAALIILALNVMPLKRGPTLACIGGMVHYTTRLATFGFPFGFLEDTTHTGNGCDLVKQGSEVFNTNDKGALRYDDYYFKRAAFTTDAAAGILFLLTLYGVVKAIESQRLKTVVKTKRHA